jgi:hypothetical protein
MMQAAPPMDKDVQDGLIRLQEIYDHVTESRDMETTTAIPHIHSSIEEQVSTSSFTDSS